MAQGIKGTPRYPIFAQRMAVASLLQRTIAENAKSQMAVGTVMNRNATDVDEKRSRKTALQPSTTTQNPVTKRGRATNVKTAPYVFIMKSIHKHNSKIKFFTDYFQAALEFNARVGYNQNFNDEKTSGRN